MTSANAVEVSVLTLICGELSLTSCTRTMTDEWAGSESGPRSRVFGPRSLAVTDRRYTEAVYTSHTHTHTHSAVLVNDIVLVIVLNHSRVTLFISVFPLYTVTQKTTPASSLSDANNFSRRIRWYSCDISAWSTWNKRACHSTVSTRCHKVPLKTEFVSSASAFFVTLILVHFLPFRPAYFFRGHLYPSCFLSPCPPRPPPRHNLN